MTSSAAVSNEAIKHPMEDLIRMARNEEYLKEISEFRGHYPAALIYERKQGYTVKSTTLNYPEGEVVCWATRGWHFPKSVELADELRLDNRHIDKNGGFCGDDECRIC